MKKLIFLLVIISSIFVKAQDIEPSQHSVSFSVGSSTFQNYYISADSGAFKQTKFSCDFLWTNDSLLNHAFDFNLIDFQSYVPRYNPSDSIWYRYYHPPIIYPKNIDLISGVRYVSWGSDGYYPMNTIMFSYEPTLYIQNPGQFYKRPNDTTRSCFGFTHIDNNIQIADTDTRLRLYHDASPGYSNPILSDPWLCYKLI